MGYADRTLKIDFSELGDGCFVTIRNPALQKVDRSPSLEVDPVTGRAKDENAATERTKDMLVRLIVDWCMWDVTVEDKDVALPLPAQDRDALDRCPVYVWNKIGEEVRARNNPQ